MEKSKVTEFFLEYFEKNRINIKEISEKTGIGKEKLSREYKKPMTAEEFLKLCVFLKIEPEVVQASIGMADMNK